jgi:hypothetical protein
MGIQGFLGGITFDGGRNGIAFRILIEKNLVTQLWLVLV